MAVPTWVSGQVLTASDVNTWFVPLAAIKTSNESVTSSTTLQNDDDLFVSVTSNSTYIVHCLINCDGASTGDIKIQFTGPAGASFTGLCNGLAIGGATGSDDQVASIDLATAKSFGLAGGAGVTRPVNIHGNLVIAGTSGTFRLQWAQDTSDATATRVLTGSHLILQRIG
jgi:hypothetical protein